jgi:hypothetical protein
MKFYLSAIPLQAQGLYPEIHRSWYNKRFRNFYSSTNIFNNNGVKGDDTQRM